MPFEGGTPLDSAFVRIRWPLDEEGVPVWQDKHEVVPSWPASTETKRALCAFIQQHTSVSDAFILRHWREHITEYVMRAENITREVLNARRFVDDAFDGQSRNARFECVWCDYKTQVSEELQEHMESCVHGFKDGEYADVEYISKYVRSCASGKPLARYEAEETNANSAWWSSTQLFIRSKLSATYDFIAKNMNGILSPGKEGTGNLETALVVYEPKQNEEMSLEESARRERETRLLAYWDEAPDWNLDRILSEEQLQTIDDAFANSGDEGTQVSAGPSHARFCPVSVKSLQTLKDGRWLNDEVNWQLALLNDIAYERSVAREEEHPRVHFFPTATLSLMSIANWMSKTRKSEREKKIQLQYQAKLYYDYDRVKTRQWTPRARARRRRRRKVGSRHTTSKDWNFVALFTSSGANHSHRSRVRAERRAVVVEIAPKRYVRALTTLARARVSERTFFFAATRRSRGSQMGPIGESSPCGVPTDRRRDAARRACAPHNDCRRCARRASAAARARRPSNSTSATRPERRVGRDGDDDETTRGRIHEGSADEMYVR